MILSTDMRSVVVFSMLALGMAEALHVRDVTARQDAEGPGLVSVASTASDSPASDSPEAASTSSAATIIINTTDQMTTATSTSTSISSSTPSPAAESPTKTKVGAIVGGIIGGAIIIAIVLALLFLRTFKRSPRSRRTASDVRWPKFPSADSQDPIARGRSSNKSSGQWSSGDNHVSTESVGSKLDGAGAVAPTDPYYFGEDEKEASHSPPQSSNLASVAPLPYGNRQASASSSVSHTPNYSHPRASARDSTNSPPFDPRLESHPPSSINPMDDRVERSSSAPGLPQPTYAPRRSSSEMVPLGRSASTRSTAAHRASRKPVPQYDASELGGHPSSNNVDLPAFNVESGPAPNLNHKSSLGEVHYLIPDMPLPNRV